MKIASCIVAALMLAVPPPAGAASLSAYDVVSIAIDSTWGGFGKPQQYHGTILRDAGGFVRENGDRVDVQAVTALLNALDAPHPASVYASDVGITKETLAAHLSAAEDVLGDFRRYANVRAAYEREYSDLHAVQAWLDAGFSDFHTDDYPRIDVKISTAAGTIDVASRSQHFMMLPFVVTRDGSDERVYDMRLPLAVAALLPENAANRRRLAAASLLQSWSSAVSMASAVRDAENTIGRNGVAQLAQKYGLRLDDYALMGSPDRWVAGVAYAADPRITAEIQSPVGDPASQFATAQQRMQRIAGIPWLKRALASNADGRIHILPGGGIFRWEPDDFMSYYKHPTAGTYLVAHQHEAVRLWIRTGTQRQYSDWYMFDDGTMILVQFDTGMNGFPFAPGGFDALPQAPGRYGFGKSFAGLLVHPDGSIETAHP